MVSAMELYKFFYLRRTFCIHAQFWDAMALGGISNITMGSVVELYILIALESSLLLRKKEKKNRKREKITKKEKRKREKKKERKQRKRKEKVFKKERVKLSISSVFAHVVVL